MLRNEGGSLGIAISTVMVDRRSQFHQSRLAEHVRPSNPMVDQTIQAYSQLREVRGGVTQAVGNDQGFALMSNAVRNQARVLGYLDVFWVFWIMALLALPLVFLMKRAVAKAGAPAH